jgi:hypothetical protein
LTGTGKQAAVLFERGLKGAIMNTGTFQPTAPTATTPSPARVSRAAAAQAAGSHRLADYVVDVFFIVLLAAPFVIFQSPASVEDAVVAAHAQPQGADATYGPE